MTLINLQISKSIMIIVIAITFKLNDRLHEKFLIHSKYRTTTTQSLSHSETNCSVIDTRFQCFNTFIL